MRYAPPPTHASYVNIHRGGKNFQGEQFQSEDFAVNGDVNRLADIELDLANGLARSQRVLHMRAIVKTRKQEQHFAAADRSPADELDQAVGGVGIRRDEHGAAGVLAVVEAEEETRAGVPFGFFVAAQRKGAARQPRQKDKDSEQITEMAERFEVTIREGRNVCGKTHAD